MKILFVLLCSVGLLISLFAPLSPGVRFTFSIAVVLVLCVGILAGRAEKKYPFQKE